MQTGLNCLHTLLNASESNHVKVYRPCTKHTLCHEVVCMVLKYSNSNGVNGNITLAMVGGMITVVSRQPLNPLVGFRVESFSHHLSFTSLLCPLVQNNAVFRQMYKPLVLCLPPRGKHCSVHCKYPRSNCP